MSINRFQGRADSVNAQYTVHRETLLALTPDKIRVMKTSQIQTVLADSLKLLDKQDALIDDILRKQ